jgi:uncharacterized repeat protein (TIGR01451 family)
MRIDSGANILTQSISAATALFCLALCSCQTMPSRSSAPLIPASQRNSMELARGGDPRFAPAGAMASALPTPATGRPGFATASDRSATSSSSRRSAVRLAQYESDDGDVVQNTPPPTTTLWPRPDQRELGPSNRWSIYGLDPRYPPAPPSRFASLPPEAYTGYPGDGYTEPGYVPRHMEEAPEREIELSDDGFSDPSVLASGERTEISGLCDQSPQPVHSCGPWKPPGISGPWPEDEYIFDGWDSDGRVKVRRDWSLEGLDPEDTIAHYDTLDGRTVVTPSCRVCIYSPRFAAVRQVLVPFGENQLVRAGGVDRPVGPVPANVVQPVTTALQPVEPVGEIGQKAPVTFLERAPPMGFIAQDVIRATVDRLKPYENFDAIRRGLIQEDEKPFLAQVVQAAIVWTLDQGVEVAINGKKAVVLEGDQRAQATYTIEPPDHPCLRVCKVASACSAKPGEIVEFTLRFDNVGDQTVGNVTIVDNLTTRLELVPGTAQCSRESQFSTEANPQGSLVLRFEISEPLKPGEGGIARFKCVVR